MNCYLAPNNFHHFSHCGYSSHQRSIAAPGWAPSLRPPGGLSSAEELRHAQEPHRRIPRSVAGLIGWVGLVGWVGWLLSWLVQRGPELELPWPRWLAAHCGPSDRAWTLWTNPDSRRGPCQPKVWGPDSPLCEFWALKVSDLLKTCPIYQHMAMTNKRLPV